MYDRADMIDYTYVDTLFSFDTATTEGLTLSLRFSLFFFFFYFFFNDTATTEIYTLSLHDALPICF